MAETSTLIHLSGPDVFYTHTSMDAYRVEQGSVFVYIVPWEKGKPGRRILLCEMSEGRVIPAFVYQDNNYKQWRFAFVSKGTGAQLAVMQNMVTTALHKNFLRRVGLNTYEQEGYQNSLTEFYKRESVKDKAYIEKAQHAAPEAKMETYGAVKAAFGSSGITSTDGNANYQTLHYLCGRLGIPIVQVEELVTRCGKNPDIADIARASHFICRRVVLDANWHKSDCGGLVGKLNDEVIACIPGKAGRYQVYFSSDGRVEDITEEMSRSISPEAYSIGRTLPNKMLTKKDIFQFCKGSITFRDMVPVVLLTLGTALIGVLLPKLNQMIYDDYIPLGNVGNLAQMCAFILSFMVGNLFFSIVKNLFDFRVTSRVGNDLQNATYHRLFHLPESFFRAYDSADLAGRVSGVGAFASAVTNALVITSLSALFSVMYFIQMCGYSGKLSWIGVGMYLVYIVVVVILTAAVHKGEKNIAEAEADASSKLYQYLNGVDKIRMAGVEDRALLSYMRPFARQQSEEIKVNRITAAKQTLDGVVSSIFSMVLYLVIVKNKVELSIGSFIAFNTAFGSFTGALEALVGELLQLYQQKETVSRFWPIFATVPEDDGTKEVLGEMSGGISLEHVSFAYEQGGKNVLNDLNIKIKPGEYVGIVGSSGCGKSTLLKLLLGFETPQSGVVMVDGKDLQSVDKGAYRKQLGVVLQNGRLISGSIYENITITAPHTDMRRVNEVIDQVGLREDIEQMPMGIHTVLSENCNTISGGQQQRILIARAIVGSPRILLFDEATSALDNLTQAVVSGNLDKMNVTRIVVAHRLSTIKNCDRILVLQDGKVAEEGNYETLMARRGLFFALASRQIAE